MWEVVVSQSVDAPAVLALAERCEQVDGVAPLDEVSLLVVRHGGQGQHLSVHDGTHLLGYAQTRSDALGWVVELVVDPDCRRRGVGTRLLRAACAHAEGRPVEVWAHGDLPAAGRLVAAAGGQAVRSLWVLGRDVDGLKTPPTPPGVHLRAFRPGEDESAWLGVNARAFADHAEQGRITMDDLLVREREPWFDPEGLVMAVDADGALLGSVWTKVHTPHLGEIYVLGVDPAAQGKGLGRVLTAAGLDHLACRGVAHVMLFVEADNSAALTTYRAAGFVAEGVHTRYRIPALWPALDRSDSDTMEV